MQNKYIIILLVSFISLIGFHSCNFKKVTKVDLENVNNYPISITIKTNNVQQSYNAIQPKSKISTTYDWTALNEEEGQFVFLVKNDQTGGVDSFTHGFIRRGELYNYVFLKSEGSELKVEISN